MFRNFHLSKVYHLANVDVLTQLFEVFELFMQQFLLIYASHYHGIIKILSFNFHFEPENAEEEGGET